MKNFIKILFVLFLMFVPGFVFAGQNHALLVGVDNYSDSLIQGPKTAAADAKALAGVLNQKYGFNTIVLTDQNATKNNILNKIDKYSKELSSEDTLFIYFSGKTEVDPMYGNAWWMPYDAFFGDTLSYIDYSDAANLIKPVKADTFIATNSNLPKKLNVSEYKKSGSDSKNSLKLLLSSSGSQSLSHSSGLSAFGYSLVKAFKEAGNREISASAFSEAAKKNGISQGVKLELHVLGISSAKSGDIKFVNNSLKKEIKEAELDKNEAKPKEKNELALNFISNPSGAEIFIENKFQGKTPLEKVLLDPGSYSVKIVKEGYKEKVQTINLSENSSKKIEVSLEKLPPEKGSLQINNLPEKAEIKFKNKDLVYKDKIMLEPGKYDLVLSAPFYEQKTITVEIPEGKDIVKNEKLSPLMVYENTISQKFLRIKKGSFKMGTPDDEFRRDPDENLHNVTISKDFFIMEKEVTIKDWKKFIEETGYKPDSENNGGALVWIGYKWDKSWKYSWKEPGFVQKGSEPATCISYNDALAFSKWISKKEGLNYSLPTEAQWEYSCRAGSQDDFAYGNCLLDTQANFAANSKRQNCPEGKYRNKTIETGKLLPNKWGLYDTHGNVMEWCLDYYSKYQGDNVVDPSGPDSGELRVIRGCGWETDINNCRAGNRFSEKPDSAKNNTGFRLVLNP
jgi:formylglycine-generating enzyme required for sulfatase activity